jgi:hypothetical protein
MESSIACWCAGGPITSGKGGLWKFPGRKEKGGESDRRVQRRLLRADGTLLSTPGFHRAPGTTPLHTVLPGGLRFRLTSDLSHDSGSPFLQVEGSCHETRQRYIDIQVVPVQAIATWGDSDGRELILCRPFEAVDVPRGESERTPPAPGICRSLLSMGRPATRPSLQNPRATVQTASTRSLRMA